MNYQKHYDLLIQRAQNRSKPEGYTERHHIIPRCCGGTDAQINIVRLTAEEHYVAHQHGTTYEELQALCLGMACHIEKLERRSK